MLLFMTLFAASLTFGSFVRAQDDKDEAKVKVAVQASVDQEARATFNPGDPFPAIVNVSSFVSTNSSVSTSLAVRMQKMVDADARLINARLASLASLRASVDTNTSLTDSQKVSLKAMVDSNVSGLNALMAKINADTDEATLKADSLKIYSDFRIYAVFIPKIKALIVLDTQSNHAAKVNDAVISVQAKIDTFVNAGVDMSKNQAALNDAKNLLSQINNKLAALTDKAESLSASDYPTVSAKAFADLKAGVKDVRNLFVKINNDLRVAIRL